ncbi:MAG: peptidoglycan DD-metalloendopeptidase family protein [Leptospira sp.]|nr:peptidoglycan DD-metalloendopeptidase family protein [Leptospira sp.]
MIFQKPRKLLYGRELLRSENFTLIYLGKGNLHYSLNTGKKLYHGSIDLKRTRFKIIPLLLTTILLTGFLGIGLDSSSAYIDPAGIKDINEDDEKDKQAKNADEKFLKQTEDQRLAIIRAEEIKTGKDTKKKLKVIHYKVKQNETLSEIATRFKVSMESIAGSSNIKTEDRLRNGQILSIPNKQGLLYKFKKGDSLAKVANYYKVTIDDVIEENKLKDSDFFSVGQKLFLPGAVIPENPMWFLPTSSKIITSGFGWRHYPRYQFHDALDLRAVYEPVKAAKSGRVIYSGWMGGYGNAIVLEHSDEMKTLYGHNSKLYVRQGEYVTGGKLISQSGCTGYCFGPHLHFEIIKNGKTINPKKFFKGLVHRKY